MTASAFTLQVASGNLSRSARLPAHVVVLARPIGVFEWRLSEEVVSAQVGMLDVAEGVGGFFFDGYAEAERSTHRPRRFVRWQEMVDGCGRHGRVRGERKPRPREWESPKLAGGLPYVQA
jgi:hypothetical protein